MQNSPDTDASRYDEPGHYDDDALASLLNRTRARSAALGRSRRRRGLGAAAVVATALAVAAVTVAVAPSSAPPARADTGTAVRFHLVGDVSTWHVVSGNVLPSASLVCPSASTCIAADTFEGAAGGLRQLERTSDGGRSWAASSLPVPLASWTHLDCVDSTVCALAGVGTDGAAALLVTTDAGASWTAAPGPGGLTSTDGVDALSCTSATACVIVASDPAAPAGTATSYTTTDGGTQWATAPLPYPFVPRALQCWASGDCVASGFLTSTDGGATVGAVLHSSDAGASWSASATPAGLGPLSTLSCADASDCIATFFADTSSEVLVSHDGGASFGAVPAVGLPGGMVTGTSCVSPSSCSVVGIGGVRQVHPALTRASGLYRPGSSPLEIAFTVVSKSGGLAASTTDGGDTWQPAALPAGVVAATDVACPSPGVCYALGIDRSRDLPVVFLASAPASAVTG